MVTALPGMEMEVRSDGGELGARLVALQRLDYAVIGDSVNVASRLERMTRELDVAIVVSNDLVTRIHKEGSPGDTQLDRLTRGGDVHVRGRVHPIGVWTGRGM